MLSFHIHSNSTSFLSSYSRFSKLDAKSEKFIKQVASLMNYCDNIGFSLVIRLLISSVSEIILSFKDITFAIFYLKNPKMPC